MTKQDQSIPPLYIVLLVMLGVIVLSRVILIGRFYAIFALLALAAIWAGYQVIKQRQGAGSFPDDEVLRQIDTQIDQCKLAIQSNKTQLSQIDQEIEELNEQANGQEELSRANEYEASRLIEGFEREKDLRRTKINFLKTCIKKLQKLRHNRALSLSLIEKAKKLQKLKEDQYEELAELESLRSDIEMSETYLETIENLSNQLELTQNNEEALILQKELIKMTDSLK